MLSRKSVYYLSEVGLATKDVLIGSLVIVNDSLKTWIKVSPLLHSTILKVDKDWERANILSRAAKISLESNKKKRSVSHLQNKRFYSTQRYAAKLNNNEQENIKDTDSSTEANLKPSNVPSSRISRLFHYGQLAAGVGVNVMSHRIIESVKGNDTNWKSLILSNDNIERIVNKFSKMRGAALKIGQLMSFQDEKILPKELYTILARVQNNANYMPQRQLLRILRREFGNNWNENFKEFNMLPIAAASIGQVHSAVLKTGEKVVVKIQYPGVKDSIDSDLNNLLMLLTASRLLPKGLFLDKTIANARKELKWECDYIKEAESLKQFEKLLENDPIFTVPHVYDDLTTSNILTMSKLEGYEIMKLPKKIETQDLKNFIAENILKLCLKEIAVYEYMQTDPNWANFFYNDKTKKIELLDFGASRSFPHEFIYKYRKLLTCATKNDKDGVFEMSKQLGYLTGLESNAMIDAHVTSVMTLGEPFSGSKGELFDFGNQTVSDRIRGNIKLMVNERLCPPPEETYSLHRKFSGVYLLCAKLGAKVHCADLFHDFFKLDE